MSASSSRHKSPLTLFLSIFERVIHIQCNDETVYQLLKAGYGGLAIPHGKVPDLSYTVGHREVDAGYFLRREGQARLDAPDIAEFLFFFEKDLTIELQRCRPDLYFLHAAAVALGEKAALLVAPSGTGKSTTAWGLLHTGFRYLSDELAPVNLDRMTVSPYPHALCLKREPPGPYPLPVDTLRTSETFHVPVEHLPAKMVSMPVVLAAIFFLRREGAHEQPSTREVSVGEASARLLANALNPLAHRADGLDAAIEIARQVRCFELHVTGLVETCETIHQTLQALPAALR